MTSLRKAIIVISVVIAGGLLLVAAYINGRNQVLINDFKTYHENLIVLDQLSPNPEFEEFLKGRYYYFANRVPSKVLKGAARDYGPFATSSLSGLSLGKGPTTPQEEYRKFKVRSQNLR